MRILLVFLLVVYFGSAWSTNDPEAKCSVERSYAIIGEDQNIGSELTFKRNWGLTCQEELQLYYEWLDNLVGNDPTLQGMKQKIRARVQQMGGASILNQ